MRDEGLCRQLWDMTDTDEFVSHVKTLSDRLGFDLTTEEIDAAMLENKRVWIERWF